MENSTLEDVKALPVMEHFYTIQGEGAFTGHAAYFIRLGGCDVGCHWCDVKESWPVDTHPKMELNTLATLASAHPGNIAVITGGEPLMHHLEGLTQTLKKAGLRTHIETSGAYPVTGTWDWICLSPKKFKLPVNEVYPLVNELKIIIYNKTDFDFAEQQFSILNSQFSIINKPITECKLFLQPEWSRKEIMTPLIVDYVKANPQWQVSLQTHKYLNIP